MTRVAYREVMQDFRQLRVWQQAHGLAARTLMATEQARRGNAALKSQLARSIASIPANIAEGAAQSSNPKYAHFLSIALGSLTESHNHLLLLEAVGALTPQTTADLLREIEALRPALIRLHQVVVAATKPTHDARPTTQNPDPHNPRPTTDQSTTPRSTTTNSPSADTP
jgi:four helix bundle protein